MKSKMASVYDKQTLAGVKLSSNWFVINSIHRIDCEQSLFCSKIRGGKTEGRT